MGFRVLGLEETQYRINIPRAEVREEKKWGVEIPVHKKVKPAIERHWAMLGQHPLARFFPCTNGTAKSTQTRRRHKGTCASPPDRYRQSTPEPTSPLSATPLAPTGNNSGAQCSQIVNLPAGYVYLHTSLPCAEFCLLDAYAHDSQHDTDFDPDMLTDEGISTG